MTPSDKPSALALSRLLGCHPDSLPTLPVTAHEVMRLMADPDAEVSQLVRVIQRDPPIAAKVLTWCNSPAFRTTQAITTLERAVTLLGMLEVRDLVLGVSLLSSLGGAALKRRILRARLWSHSLVTAVLAERLARDFLGLGPGFHTQGLLHDLGKVALDAFRSDEVNRVLARLNQGGATWREAEAELLHFDHAFLGAQLMEFWGLPPTLVAVAAWHHEPWLAGELADQAGVVFLADLLAHRLGHHCHQPEASAVRFEELPGPAQDFLKQMGWDLEDMVQAMGGEEDLARLATQAAEMGPQG